MKSFRNHLSLIIALATILFTVQIFLIIERSTAAYETTLKNDYSILVVAERTLEPDAIVPLDRRIDRAEAIDPGHLLESLKGEIDPQSIALLSVTLPRFYRIHLKHYPTPAEINSISATLKRYPRIERVENFSQNHDLVYKLLLLYKKVSVVFSAIILIVTTLLIFKELKIWQYQHRQRMNIMALFGAPLWLRSAVLFRLALVDAIIASVLVNLLFIFLVQYQWVEKQLMTIGIRIDVYLLSDAGTLFGIAMSLSILLATLVTLGHKEAS